MQTVLVVWEHGGNLGHLARLLPIVRELRGRGCAVVVATAHPTETAKYFDPGEVRLIQTPSTDLPSTDGKHFLTPAEIVLYCGLSDTASAYKAVLAWLYWFAQLKPYAVLVDASPVAAFAANFAGIPLVIIGSGFELPPAQHGTNFAPWLSKLPPSNVDAQKRLRSNLDQLTQALRANSTRSNAEAEQQHFELNPRTQTGLCIWPELDHFERAQVDGRYLGPIWSDVPDALAVTWPDKPGPKVLCYLGLIDKRYDLLLQALVKQGANVMVVSPSGEPGVCAAMRGWGVVVHQVAIQLEDVLKDAASVICNGGIGLVSRALHCGKPLMLVPSQLEQALLCYQLLNRGLAVGTLSLQDAEQVRARVNTLLSDKGLQQRVQSLAARYQMFTPALAIERVIDILLHTEQHNQSPVREIEMVLGLAPEVVNA